MESVFAAAASRAAMALRMVTMWGKVREMGDGCWLSLRGWGLALLAVMAGGCVLSGVDLNAKRCPCSRGWVCDEATQTCVRRPYEGGDRDAGALLPSYAPPEAPAADDHAQGSAPNDQAPMGPNGTPSMANRDHDAGVEPCDAHGNGCVDLCPQDPLKREPGVCGCGNSDADSDGDGEPDCPAMLTCSSFGFGQALNFKLENRCDVSLEVIWVDPLCSTRSYGWVDPGDTFGMDTYEGHAWQVHDEDGEVVFEFVMDADHKHNSIDCT